MELRDVSWDRANQQFVVELALKHGLANAGERAGFKVGLSLTVDTGDRVVELDPLQDPVAIAPRTVKDNRNLVELVPISLPWDECYGSITGKLKVTVSAHLINPSGGGMTQIDPPSLQIDGGVPEDDED
jgi:hypothetical protein